jgi:hypothetical protein
LTLAGIQEAMASPRVNIPSRNSIAAWCARIAAGMMIVFGAFQIAPSMGAPWGRMTWGGAPEILPWSLRLASAAATIVLFASASAMLVRSGDIGRRLAQRPFWWINLLLVVLLAFNTLGNLSSSEPGERVLMGAASTSICLFCFAALFRRADKPLS